MIIDYKAILKPLSLLISLKGLSTLKALKDFKVLSWFEEAAIENTDERTIEKSKMFHTSLI